MTHQILIEISAFYSLARVGPDTNHCLYAGCSTTAPSPALTPKAADPPAGTSLCSLTVRVLVPGGELRRVHSSQPNEEAFILFTNPTWDLTDECRSWFSNRRCICVSCSSTRSDTAMDLTMPERGSWNCLQIQSRGMQVWRT
jgi:hypothetical protein